MKKPVFVIALVLIFCLAGCGNSKVNQVEETDPFEFLQGHVDLEKEMEQEGFTYIVEECTRGNTSEEYYRISIGTSTEDKFTALQHYYVNFNFSEIIKANLTGEDIVIWSEE